MKAIILAGGFGTRLHPLMLEYPKPMTPLANKPVLAHILNLLKSHHFSEMVITVQYLAEQIQNYFGNGCSNLSLKSILSYYIALINVIFAEGGGADKVKLS